MRELVVRAVLRLQAVRDPRTARHAPGERRAALRRLRLRLPLREGVGRRGGLAEEVQAVGALAAEAAEVVAHAARAEDVVRPDAVLVLVVPAHVRRHAVVVQVERLRARRALAAGRPPFAQVQLHVVFALVRAGADTGVPSPIVGLFTNMSD